MVKKSDADSIISEYVASIMKDKKYENVGMMRMDDKPQNVETITTGSMNLDLALGGGIAKGRLIEIYGPESSGKTTIALTTAANVQKNAEEGRGYVAFIDMEHALDIKYAEKLGVKRSKTVIAQPTYAEKAMDLIVKLTEEGMFDLIILDSIAAMPTKTQLEGGAEDLTVGALARVMSRELIKVLQAASNTNTTILLINQTRDQIGGFSPMGVPQTTPGGKATKFFATQRIEVKRSFITERGEGGKDSAATAAQLKFEVKKNKIAPPGAKAETIIRYGSGIDLAAELVTAGPKLGVIHMPNNRTYVDPETGDIFAKSKADAIDYLNSHPDFMDTLTKRAKAASVDKDFDSADLMTDEDINDTSDAEDL